METREFTAEHIDVCALYWDEIRQIHSIIHLLSDLYELPIPENFFMDVTDHILETYT